MPQSLKSRKKKLVHDAIYEAAIDLFIERGFEETTVEEVAQAAGVSRRSFFRYFASKDDLLAQSVVNYGKILVSAIETCPAEYQPLQVVKKTVLEALQYVAAQPRTREVIVISERSPSAAQAHLSRMVEVQARIAEAFAARENSITWNSAEALLLGGLTTLAMGAAIVSWAHGESPDMAASARQAFKDLSRLLSGQNYFSTATEPNHPRKAPRAASAVSKR